MLDFDAGDADARVGRAVTLVLRKPLRRRFLKMRIFGPRSSPSTTPMTLRVGDKRRAGEHLAAVLLEEEHPVDGDLVPGSASMRSTVTTEPGVTLT